MKPNIGMMILGVFSTVLLLFAVFFGLISIRQLSDFGETSAARFESNIRRHMQSYLMKTTRERAMRYGEVFRSIGASAAGLADHAAYLLDRVHTYAAATPDPIGAFTRAPGNRIWYTDPSKLCISAYWGEGFLSGPPPADAVDGAKALSHLDPLLKTAKNANPGVLACMVVLETGLGGRYYPNENRLVLQLPPPSVYDLRDAGFYVLTRPNKNPENEPLWTPSYYETLRNDIVITVGAPVISEAGRFLGASGIDVSVTTLLKEVLEAKTPSVPAKDGGSFSMIVDATGLIVALRRDLYDNLGIAVDPEREKQIRDVPNVFNEYRLKDSRLPDVRALNDRMAQKGGTFDRIDLSGTSFLVSIQPLPRVNWRLVSALPESAVMESVVSHRKSLSQTVDNMILRLFWVAFACFAGAVIIVGWFSSRYFITPLKTLTRAADRIGTGEFPDDVEIRGNDEIGTLAGAFNDMTRKLRSARELEETYTKRLEQEVEERTSALSQANRELKFEMEERERTYQELKDKERQLFRAQKMETLGVLSSSLAHEFNNILHVIGQNTEYLAVTVPAEQTETVNAILNSRERGADLIRQLLSFGRNTESRLSSIRLNAEIRRIWKIIAGILPKNIDVHLNLKAGNALIMADRGQLEQILTNLVINAKDAMPGGGRLNIETDRKTVDEHLKKRHPEIIAEECAVLSVSDTGCGIDKADRERIFEPFFTTKKVAEGTGLGMSVVYGITRAHGGVITCDSEVGKGTTFRLLFPLLKSESAAMAQEGTADETTASIRGRNETILLVDDETTVLSVMGESLKRIGYNIVTAESGEAAVRVFQKMRPDIDLVILDLWMPGIGGKMCLTRLREIDPAVKVIITSGYKDREILGSIGKNGAREFLQKPFSRTVLARTVRKILNSA